MSSSNNLATIEPWMFRSDSWADSFAKETESALTKALQQSFFATNQQQSQIINHPIISSSFLINQTDYNYTTTPSASTVTASGSGSEPETPGSKRRGPNLGVSAGKPSKRKSRASKRSMTMFIQADTANFRQMVQQVTGVKHEGTGQFPVVKPEPLRQPFVSKLQGLLLPTLDTSAYLLHHQDNNTTTAADAHRIPDSGSTLANQVTEDGVDFYSFGGFPTLESSF